MNFDSYLPCCHSDDITFHCGSVKDVFVAATLKLSIRIKAAETVKYSTGDWWLNRMQRETYP